MTAVQNAAHIRENISLGSLVVPRRRISDIEFSIPASELCIPKKMKCSLLTDSDWCHLWERYCEALGNE
jgi:hypothetical protein